ncbi:MAG: phage major capsid protein [Holosporales bacterium]|jgi:HK97 family phage major capsid protein|nr:phage major capsid protein [Holosporales bacterium]
MTISDERPAIPNDPAYSDIKKFISYLKGDKNDQEAMSIPVTITNHIIDKIQALSPIKAISRVTTTSSDRLDVVIDSNDSDESGWVTNEIIRGDELATISKISIHLHQLFAKPKVSHSLLDDHSIKVEEFIKDKITTQMAASENKSFLFGDGVNQPKGILSYEVSTEGPQAQQIEGIVGGKLGEIQDCSKIVELMELLPSKYLCGATWIMSRNAASHIRTIKDETTRRFLWQNSIAHGVPDTLLGYPVVICDDMPKVSEKTETKCVPVLFANLYEGYHIAEKPNITILKDPYNSKPFIEFYATKRIGGDVVNFNAIKALVLQGADD